MFEYYIGVEEIPSSLCEEKYMWACENLLVNYQHEIEDFHEKIEASSKKLKRKFILDKDYEECFYYDYSAQNCHLIYHIFNKDLALWFKMNWIDFHIEIPDGWSF